MIVYGSSISPFVRKVMVVAQEKGIDRQVLIETMEAAILKAAQAAVATDGERAQHVHVGDALEAAHDPVAPPSVQTGSVVGGLVVVRDGDLHERLRFLQNAAGAVPGPWDCWLVLRGLNPPPGSSSSWLTWISLSKCPMLQTIA